MAKLEDKTIAIVGYGNQGSVWAKNLAESGWKVFVSGRPNGNGYKQSNKDRFEWIDPFDLLELNCPVAILLPDSAIKNFFKLYFNSSKRSKAACFVFAHGYGVTFKQFDYLNEDQLLLVAPKGIAAKLRENYLAGSGVMGALGVANEGAFADGLTTAKSIAEGLGILRVGWVPASFDQECYGDLFSEQLLLCGLVPELITKSIKFLNTKGIPNKLSTFECLHELKLIIDLLIEQGFEKTFDNISPTAFYGGIKVGKNIIPDQQLEAAMEKIWQNITSGKFVESMDAELAENPHWFAQQTKLMAEKSKEMQL